MRLLILWVKSLFLKAPVKVAAVSACRFRVMPWHCDPNLHLTNSKYFYFMDYARFWRLMEVGVWKDIFVKKRWMPMAVSQEITYIRDIAPFEKFEIRTQLAGWNDKYHYIVQEFYGKKGLCAKAMVRAVYVSKGKVVPTEEVLALFGDLLPIEKYQARITTWEALLEIKKAEAELSSE